MHCDLFPDRLSPSELGNIPEGWEVKTPGNTADVSDGKRPVKRLSVGADSANVPVWGSNGPMAFTSESLVGQPAVVTGRVGTLGSVFRLNSPCWPSSNTLVVTPRFSQHLEFLFLLMQRINCDSLNRGWT